MTRDVFFTDSAIASQSYGTSVRRSMSSTEIPCCSSRFAAWFDLSTNSPSLVKKLNAAFIEKVRAAVQKYRDIGVRVEDSFLLTDKELVLLSSKVPRTIADIEATLASR